MAWQPDIPQHAFAFERAAVTPYTFLAIFMPTLLVYYAMAVLVQLPHTRLYRAAFLPAVFWVTLRANASLDLSCDYRSYDYLNHGLALGMFIICLRCTGWTFAQRPYIRLPICKAANATIHVQRGKTATEDDVSASSAMWNACDLVANFRLIGWNEPHKRFIPEQYFRVESRPMFILITIGQVLFLTLVADILCKATHAFGPESFGTSKGGTLFDPSLPPLERYMKSSIVSLLSSISAYIVLTAVYKLHAVLFIILFRQYPSQWPPLFDAPWLSTSLTDFWGRRWHQILREPLVGVARPLFGSLFGPVGIVVGAFALSGVLHEIGGRGMGRGGDTIPVMGFFLISGVGVAIEHACERATGKRVGGVRGWLWMSLWFFVSGQLLVDVWARNGLLASKFWPEEYSLTTLILEGMGWKV